MSYAEEIIRQSIKDAKLHKSQERRKHIEKLLNYYTGTDTWKYIAGPEGNYFDSQSINAGPPYQMNLTQKFIAKKCNQKAIKNESSLNNFFKLSMPR